MTNINIQIPDELHKKLKIVCAIGGISLKQFVLEVIEKQVKDDSKK